MTLVCARPMELASPRPAVACALIIAMGFVQATELNVKVVDHTRRTIYHSPQSPGFTSWVGTWAMPDGSVMVCFTQATGPFDGRPCAPAQLQHKLSWPPAGKPGYDMTGLDMRNVHLRSFDRGETWQQVSADPFKSCMNGCTGQCEIALGDGTILRGVWGHYLPYNPELPKTGYLQRSTDGSCTWDAPELLLDPKQYSVWPKRIRLLQDGRLIITGGVARVAANTMPRGEYCRRLEPLLLVSDDDGKTWRGPIDVIPPEHRGKWGGEEYDAAELPGGDLLCVFRRKHYDEDAGRFVGGQVRWQERLRKQGLSWLPGGVGPAPFPHSGHPELLATREGAVIHAATSGLHWTVDAGKTWHELNVPATRYYPRSVQTPDGWIYIFWHVGGDNAYGAVDQSIGMDRFRLAVEGP